MGGGANPTSIAGDAVSLASTGLIIGGAAVPLSMMNKLAQNMGNEKPKRKRARRKKKMGAKIMVKGTDHIMATTKYVQKKKSPRKISVKMPKMPVTL
jgi:hypothetical protein